MIFKPSQIRVVFFCLFLFSCTKRQNVITLETNHGNGLKVGDSVYVSKIAKGVITDIALNKKYKPCFTLTLRKDMKIPKDSRFNIYIVDFFSKGIEIVPGKSRSMLSSEDTIREEILQQHFRPDSLLEKISIKFTDNK